MFEDSLVISQVQSTSSTERWTALASITLQFALAAFVITLPLLHPEKLAFRADSPLIFTPPPPKPPTPIQHIQTSSVSSSTAAPVATQPHTEPTHLSKLLRQQNDDAPSPSPIPFGKGMADGLPISLEIGDAAHTPRIAVAPTHVSNNPVRVSSGVSAGMLITPIHPVYPDIARVAQVQGTVIVEAIISRTGTIESLRIVSGPAMLQRAAIDAIRAARYQPYRLNGSPIEVQTTISVNFRLGS